MELLVY